MPRFAQSVEGPEPLDVEIGIEPLTALRPGWGHGAVAPLPRAEHMRGESGTLGDEAHRMAGLGGRTHEQAARAIPRSVPPKTYWCSGQIVYQ